MEVIDGRCFISEQYLKILGIKYFSLTTVILKED